MKLADPSTPLSYADFMDLADVIGRTDNWRDTSEPVFWNQNDMRAGVMAADLGIPFLK